MRRFKRGDKPMTNKDVRKVVNKFVDQAQVILDEEFRGFDHRLSPKLVDKNRTRHRRYESCRHIPLGTAVVRLHTLVYEDRPRQRYITANPVENGTPRGLRSSALTPTISRAKARRLAAGYRKADA